MAEQQTKSPDVKINALRALNLSAGRHALQPGEFDRVFGAYPARTGLLKRFPGKELWRLFPGRNIRAIHQTFDRNGSIIIQNGDRLDIYTLDELRGRGYSPALVRPPIEEEETMSYALLLHTETNGTNGGALGASRNTFYQRELNTKRVDADNIVTLAANQFTLETGVYRITAQFAFGAQSDRSVGCCLQLYSITHSRIAYYRGGTVNITGTSQKSPDAESNAVGWVTIEAEIDVSDATEIFEFRQANSDNTGTSDGVASEAGATGRASGVTSGSPVEIYGSVKILLVE